MYRKFYFNLAAPIYVEQMKIKLSERYLFNLIKYFITKIETPLTTT